MGHPQDEHWDKKGNRMKPPNYEADLASAFPLKYDSPTIRPTPPQGGSAISHEHLWRVVAVDTSAIRWCERCGTSYVLVDKHPDWLWCKVEER